MTRGELRTRILNSLNDSTTSPVFWSVAQMNTVIQEGLETMSEEAEAVKRTTYVGLQEGCLYYSMRGIAQDCMLPTRVYNEANNRRLVPTSVDELDSIHYTWGTVPGDPLYWFPMGWEWFGIWPSPAASGGRLRVDYLAWPRELLDDDDEPELYDADHEALVLYGNYEGCLKRWDFDGAVAAWSLFLRGIGAAQQNTGMRRAAARGWQANKSGPAGGFRNLNDRFGGTLT